MFGSSDSDVALLLAAGVVSTIPLLLFTEAARRLPYATVGMLQFIAPTVQFLLAVLVYGEPVTRAHAHRLRRDLDRGRALHVGHDRPAARQKLSGTTSRTPSMRAQLLDHRGRHLAVDRHQRDRLATLGAAAEVEGRDVDPGLAQRRCRACR